MSAPPVSSPAPGTVRDPYWPAVRDAMPRLLGAMDREPLSPTVGSFDRDHWAWKFRDLPINMLQAGLLPLTWAWSHPRPDNPWFGSDAVRGWIVGGVEAILARQHANGAFDTVGPYTQDHGVTLAMGHLLATVVSGLRASAPESLRQRTADALTRAVHFAARSSEDYAFISNHQALFALAWQRMGTFLGDRACAERGAATVDAILAHQSADGWFAEYGGPDPGYESLGLHYLAQYAAEAPHGALSAAMERALAFHAWMVQPDGGLSPVVGSRHTVQWYPSGFELLAETSAVARGTAEFLRARLHRGAMVTPATVDTHNLPILLHSYCLASDCMSVVSADLPRLGAEPPCTRAATSETRFFPASGVTVASTPHYHAVVALGRGGTISVVAKDDARLAYEDAGYVAESAADGSRWASSFQGMASEGQFAGQQAIAEAVFSRARQEVLTPWKFVVLRLLNLTAFRSVTLGAFLRRMIIARLVTGRERGPLALRRTVDFTDDRIVLTDSVRWVDGVVRLGRLVRPRAFTGVHMGSSRYYHPRDLADVPEADLGEAARRLSGGEGVTVTTTLSFGDEAHPAIVQLRQAPVSPAP